MRPARFFGAFSLLALLTLISGCLTSGTKDSGGGMEDATFLTGTWTTGFDSTKGDLDTVVFYMGGSGRYTSYLYDKDNGTWVLVAKDTAALANCGVTHGMLHFVYKANPGSLFPDIEYWEKYVLQGNLMTWYKGVLLHGGTPGVLVGNWQLDPSSLDTNIQPYFYNFKNNDVLYISRSGVVLDSFAITVAGSGIQQRNLKSGKTDSLQYEFDGAYMRLFNPSSKTSYTKVN